MCTNLTKAFYSKYRYIKLCLKKLRMAHQDYRSRMLLIAMAIMIFNIRYKLDKKQLFHQSEQIIHTTHIQYETSFSIDDNNNTQRHIIVVIIHFVCPWTMIGLSVLWRSRYLIMNEEERPLLVICFLDNMIICCFSKPVTLIILLAYYFYLTDCRLQNYQV